ncbi:MAG: putative 2-hydroxyglutaryl-CoA dehydratase [Promethearchaeota archaeon CR_4]|nr:MAG: putative 2-hydroxyglutaryl-CoA dehydratase [Candidatus Lokiarchaeota archaeon CR_4]
MEFTIDFAQEINEFLVAAKASGKKVIGIIGHDIIPEEIILAADAVPLRLIFAGTEALTNEGGNYLSPTTCVFSRAILGMFARREEDHLWHFLQNLDALIVSNYCNGDNNCELVKQYFNIPLFRLYIPYKRTDPALAQYRSEITRLRNAIGEFCGTEIIEDALWSAIKTTNEIKFKLMQLSKMPLPGRKKQELFYRAMLFGSKVIPELDKVLNQTDLFGPELKGKKVLLTGAAPFIGDPLIELFEGSGAVVIENLTWTGTNYAMQFANTSLQGQTPAIDELVQVFKKNESSEHYVPYSHEKVAERIYKFCTDEGISGVVYHILKFCEFTGTLKDKIRDILIEKGLKVLQIERDYSATATGQLSTRIEAFLEML